MIYNPQSFRAFYKDIISASLSQKSISENGLIVNDQSENDSEDITHSDSVPLARKNAPELGRVQAVHRNELRADDRSKVQPTQR